LLSDSFEVSTSNFDLFDPGDFYHSTKHATVQPNHQEYVLGIPVDAKQAEENAKLRGRSATATSETTTASYMSI
jgi:hypothetical protein